MLERAKAVRTVAPHKFNVRRPAIIVALLCALLAAPGAWAQGNDRTEQLSRAATLIGSDQLLEAERLLNQVLKVAPNEATALNLMGALRAKQGKLDEAETLFTRAVRSDAAMTGARMNLAHLYLLKGAPEKTAVELQEVLRLEPGNAEAGYRLAWLLLAQGRIDECINLVEKLKGSRAVSAPLLGVAASAYLKKGNKVEAVSALKSAIELRPDDASYYFTLGVAWLTYPADLVEADLTFRQFLKLRPDDAQGQLYLGYVLLKHKQYGEARGLLEKSVQKGPGTPEAFYYLGLIAQGQNEDARAIEFFEKSIRLAPSFAHAHIGLGATYLKLKDYERARQALETGVKLSPQDTKAHYNLAMLYARLKNPERAQEEMRIVEKMKKEGKAQADGEDDIQAPQPQK
ncbi:MAG TPA: tetratricopeptide repeat protein [Pyrinomonadaceae bacterium]|nr:tetratricopeptide repeat protein [Pyrinomonadaceae bacterium]